MAYSSPNTNRATLAVLFRVACNVGLEEIVSKHLDRAYGAGGCRHGIKIKNPAHLAYSRGQGEHCSTIVTHDCRRTDTKDLRHP
jgi:ATP-dependent DNA ligase